MSQPPSNSRTACLSAGQLAEFERIVAGFEQEWLAGRQPEIEPLLPGNAALRPAVLAELVRIDAEFRSKAGKPVAAAAYVQRFPELGGDESLTQSVSGADGATIPEQPKERDVVRSAPPREIAAAATGAGEAEARFDERLLASRLVSKEQLRECLKAVAEDGAVNAKRLAAELLRRRMVTGWQLDRLNAGRTDFFIDQNRYLLLSLIGQGGMGAVYRARHVRMNRDVAVKVIDPKRVTDPKLIQRFRREVEVCSKLQHEHIVQAHDVGEHAGATFLVLEFVEGADLASLVRRNGPMAAGDAVTICLQAAAGLAYAHSLGIVHRDIKPQNILLSTAGIVKILDMGLARVLDETGDDPHTSLTQEGAVMGTVDYMPPEQARDTRRADARSDIYSLGATLYYLLAGHAPFAGGSVIERLHRLAVESPVPIGLIRTDCPPVLDEIVQKMLAKRPEDRFPSAGEVIRALQPLAVPGIAARAVVTPAVQSASDTLRAGVVLDTSAEISFVPTEESIASSIRSRTAPKRSSRSIMLAAGVVVILLAVLATWQWNRSGGRPLVGQGELSPVVPKSTTKGEKNRPREIIRQMPGHFASVNRVAWSPDGKLISTGGFDGEVRVRKPAVSSNNTNFSQTVTLYRGHRAGIHNLVWSRTGKLIASGDLYGEIHVWQALTGEPVARVRRKSQVVTLNPYDWLGGIALSPDDRELAFEENGNVVRYNIPEKRRIPVGAGGGAWLCYSPSGKYLASSAGPYVWDTKTGTPVYGAPSNPTRGAGVALIPGFLHDDTLVLMSERNIRLWNCRDNRLLRDVEIPLAALGLHSIPLVALSFAGERCLALTVTEAIDIELPEGTVTPRRLKQPLSETSPGNRLTQYRCWDVEFVQGRIVVGPNVFDGAMGGPVFSFPDWALGIDVHGQRWIGDAFLVAAGVVWDLKKGEITTEIPASAEALENGRYRHVDAGNTIVERTVAENEMRPFSSVKCDGLEDEPGWRGLVLAEGGSTAWSARHDGPVEGGIHAYRIRIWDAAKGGQPVRTLALQTPGFEAFMVSRDGRIVVSVVGDRCDIYREGSDAQPLEIRPEYGVDMSHIALSPDGRRIAIGPGQQSGGEAVTIWDTGKGATKPQRIATGLNSILDPYRIQFSSSGRYLLVTRKLWDVSGEKPVLVWEAPEQDHAVALPNDCALRWGGFCPDERHVAIAQDGVFQIWDWREKKAEKLATIFLLPTGDPVFANHLNGHVSWSPASNQFLRVPHALTDGSIDWVSLHEYETRTGWKNDFEQAGLDLRKRTRESNAAAGTPRP